MSVSGWLFWGSAGWVAYTYAVYPSAIWSLSKLRARPKVCGSEIPSVSVVMAVRNGVDEIDRKLKNLLNLDYPADKLQIVVVSDGSTDGTTEVLSGLDEPRVEAVVLPRSVGKPGALNQGVARCTGEILVFCDVRQRIDKHALRALVARFADPSVGAVSGELLLDADRGPGVYWQYEKLIRAAESAVDSVPGATGALYAVRRALYRDLPSDCLLDDVFTPMNIVLAGKRVVFEPAARAYDREASVSDEFQRKSRTLAGNFQLLQQLPGVLDPRRNRILWQFASHKLARLACPYALLFMFGANVRLATRLARNPPGYRVLLGAQVVAYALALRGAWRGEQANRVERVAHTFVTLNLAAVEGLRRFVVGDMAWTSASRVASPGHSGPGSTRP